MMTPGIPTSPDDILPLVRAWGRDKLLGIRVFSYGLTKRLDGRLRALPEDFMVSEVLRDGSVATTAAHRARDGGTHPLYVMVKRNLDTLTAVGEFSSAVGLKPWDVDHLGLKDKRALTFQFISPVKSHALRKVLRGSSWEAHLIAMSPARIRPFDLRGNLFWTTIRLRAPTPVAEVRGVLDDFRSRASEVGLLNFFGHQRFGGRKPVNHIAGYLIAKRDYEAACKVMLCAPCPGEAAEFAEARADLFEGRDRDKLARLARSSFPVERRLAKNLLRHDWDARRSILSLPANLLRFLLESFSSFLFNDTLSAISDRLLGEQVREGALYVNTDKAGGFLTTYARATPSNARRIGEDLRLRRAVPAVACPGFMTGSAVEDRTMEAMADLGVGCPSFQIQERPDAGYPGQVRPAIVFPRLISASPIDEGSAFLSFFLPRSSYATILLRELLARRRPSFAEA